MNAARSALCCICLVAFPLIAAPAPDLPDQRGLMTLLKDHMAGQPVIAIGVGDIGTGVHFDEAAYAKETKPIGRLQAISAAVSADKETYIPYLVRNTWVIAPETREDVRTDLTGVPDLQAEGGGLLLDQVVLSLAPDLLNAAGSDAGILASRLPMDAQKMLSLVLKPPIKVTKSHDGEITLWNGEKREGWVYDQLGQITEPLDLSTVRLRARLWIEAANVTYGGTYQRLGQQRRHELPGTFLGGWRNVEAPVETVASNQYKPSDLDGKPYTQPFGASGVMTVADALKKVEKAAGLTLYPGSYTQVPVFVGSPTITCGEVLDGLRLAIAGAWRKIGKGYYLCWDRRGVAALNQTLEETSSGLVERINGIVSSTKDDFRWLDIAMKMPFAPGDPLALTDAQRGKIYGDLPAGQEGGSPNGEGVTFAEMTPEQQEYLLACGKTDQMDVYPPGGPTADFKNPQHRPFTPEDVHSAQLGTGYAPHVALEIQLPGFGWVRSVLDHGQSLEPYYIRQIRDRAAVKAAQSGNKAPSNPAAEPPARPQPPAVTFDPKPFSIAAPDRGIMVGPLRGDALNTLADTMKAKRFTTLYYPILFDGYATFPNAAFPQHPDLKGENGMAAALAAAKAHGVRVVGYLSTVAWRPQRSLTHWLEKHPDWLDRDPLGRSRLEWIKDREQRHIALPVSLPDEVRWDYVSPSEPEVARRLTTLVQEFSRLDASGLMVLDWRKNDDVASDLHVLPPLGFSLSARLDWLAKTGLDPLDATPGTTRADSVYVGSPLDLRILGLKSGRALMIRDGEVQTEPPLPDPYANLVDGLFQRAKALRKDWTTYLAQDFAAMNVSRYGPAPDAPEPNRTPKADRLINPWPADAGGEGLIMPDIPWDDARNPSEAHVGWNSLFREWSEGLSAKAKLAVIDFRRHPSSIAEIIKYVQ